MVAGGRTFGDSDSSKSTTAAAGHRKDAAEPGHRRGERCFINCFGGCCSIYLVVLLHLQPVKKEVERIYMTIRPACVQLLMMSWDRFWVFLSKAMFACRLTHPTLLRGLSLLEMTVSMWIICVDKWTGMAAWFLWLKNTNTLQEGEWCLLRHI